MTTTNITPTTTIIKTNSDRTLRIDKWEEGYRLATTHEMKKGNWSFGFTIKIYKTLNAALKRAEKF